MENNNIAEIVKKVMAEMNGSTKNRSTKNRSTKYPLAENSADILKTKTGKDFNDITFEGVITGKITHEDFKTDPNTLLMQADIAEKAGKTQFAENLRRAAELTNVPDDEVLRIYDKLRPNRATKQELIKIAEELKAKYNANKTADFIQETAEIYEVRGILRALPRTPQGD